MTVSGSGTPLAEALVCCYKDGEVHASGRTDASGKAGISIELSSERSERASIS